MTLFELQADTARLGFLPDIGEKGTFLACANRALLRLHGLRPLQRTARLLHLTEENLLQDAGGIVVTTTPISVQARGARAYAFYGIGEGSLRITARDSSSNEEEMLVGERDLTGEQFYEGGIFLDATPISQDMEVKLTFLPNGPLQIEAPALYAMEMPNRDERCRESTTWMDYDLRALCSDLLSCEGISAIGGRRYRRGEIKNGNRHFLPDAEVGDAARLGITMPNAYTVRIPMDCPGIYTVSYFAAPTPLTGEENQEIDLPADLTTLLPLACAAELFYEEDPEKSAFYLKNLQAQIEHIRLYTPEREITVADRTGW